ncbi:MAG: globin [Deltaproteobacteria bacterium]|nr:globin [Deltaproteobacteria bacterium]
MNAGTLRKFEESLGRCLADPDFLDIFYGNFLGSSPKVREKFAGTDFDRQKAALQASFDAMLKAAHDEEDGPEKWLGPLAERHGARQLRIGAELYDLWLDNLLKAVKVCDAGWSEEVEQAWEAVMGVGIRYLCSRYNS